MSEIKLFLTFGYKRLIALPTIYLSLRKNFVAYNTRFEKLVVYVTPNLSQLINFVTKCPALLDRFLKQQIIKFCRNSNFELRLEAKNELII